MVQTRGGLARWVMVGALLVASAAAWRRRGGLVSARARRAELDEARRAMAEGRWAWARERLTRMAEQRAGDGEVLLLLGECELDRGRGEGGIDPRAREAALAAWGRIPASSPAYPRAARLRAIQSINAGRYAAAEQILDDILASPRPDEGLRYELERALQPALPPRGADGRCPSRAAGLVVPIAGAVSRSR